MKKQYSKPGIIIEDFRISQHIASCGVPHQSQWGSPKHWSKTSCAWEGPFGEMLFSKGMVNICTDPIGPGDKVGEICYDNPEGGITIFGS